MRFVLMMTVLLLGTGERIDEADRLRKEGAAHLENTLVPGYDSEEQRKAGIAALEKAREIYEEVLAADPSLSVRVEEAIVDINAQLFWARRDAKVDLGEKEEDPERRAAEALSEVERYEKENPSETFRIMVRYFEVAKRYVGTPGSLAAQEKAFDLQNRIIEARKRSLEKGPCEQSLDVNAFEESFRAIPEGDQNCLLYFGDLLQRNWMDDEAIICFEAILRRSRGPFTERARVRLAESQIRIGRMEEARAALEMGAAAGEKGAQDLLGQISGTEYGRLERALVAAREKSDGDRLRALIRVAEDMRESREILTVLPVEAVCSEICDLVARQEKTDRSRGAAPCKVCADEGKGEETGSFMTCALCRGTGKEEKWVIKRVLVGRRMVSRKEKVYETCSKCGGNKRVICEGCAGMTSLLGDMTKKEKRLIEDLRDKMWSKKLMTRAKLAIAIRDLESHVVKKELTFLAYLDAPFHRSEEIRTLVGAAPLAGRAIPGEAEAIWLQASAEVRLNFLLSWATDFAQTLSAVAFLDDPKAGRALRAGPDAVGDAAFSPEEAGAFPEEMADGFIRIRGKLDGHEGDEMNPYLEVIQLRGRFPHTLLPYVWKGETKPILERLAGSYALDYLDDLVGRYDFSAESRLRLVEPGTLVILTGRVIPSSPPRFEVWRIEPEIP